MSRELLYLLKEYPWVSLFLPREAECVPLPEPVVVVLGRRFTFITRRYSLRACPPQGGNKAQLVSQGREKV